MALRDILNEKEELLHKVSRPVTEFDEKLWQLLDDMAETLHKADGVGLAAPQVGVLRRLFIMDFGEGVIEAINPKIINPKGRQEGLEGCLSVPGEWGITDRPATCTLQAQDRYGKEFTLTGSDLMARCMCHENDHLDGILFKQRAVRMLDPSELED